MKSNLVSYQRLTAVENMSVDDVLFHRVRDSISSGVVRFYSWTQPAISIGYFQKISDIQLERCAENNITVVRRMTGGRAVYHSDDLNITLIFKVSCFKHSQSRIQLFRLLSELLIAIFKPLGIQLYLVLSVRGLPNQPNCFQTSSMGELQDSSGFKRIGSALLVRDGVVLMQNSIPIEPCYSQLNRYLTDSFIHQQQSEQSYDWNHLFASSNTMSRTHYLAQKLQNEWMKQIPTQLSLLDEQEGLNWNNLIKNKYSSQHWNQRI